MGRPPDKTQQRITFNIQNCSRDPIIDSKDFVLTFQLHWYNYNDVGYQARDNFTQAHVFLEMDCQSLADLTTLDIHTQSLLFYILFSGIHLSISLIFSLTLFTFPLNLFSFHYFYFFSPLFPVKMLSAVHKNLWSKLYLKEFIK